MVKSMCTAEVSEATVILAYKRQTSKRQWLVFTCSPMPLIYPTPKGCEQGNKDSLGTKDRPTSKLTQLFAANFLHWTYTWMPQTQAWMNLKESVKTKETFVQCKTIQRQMRSVRFNKQNHSFVTKKLCFSETSSYGTCLGVDNSSFSFQNMRYLLHDSLTNDLDDENPSCNYL